MGELSNRINKFISKQAIHIGSKEEAEQYGIKLPPEEVGQKWEHKDKKPAQATLGEKPQFKPLPKEKKVARAKESREPKRLIHNKRRFSPTQASAMEEVAHQLTPKGPGYHAPEEIINDIKESQRIARKLSGQKHKNIEE